jgi:hypothetical protein
LRTPRSVLFPIVAATVVSACAGLPGADGGPIFRAKISTAAAEADFLWSQLGDLPFYRTNHYDLALPEGRIMEDLVRKAENGGLANEHRSSLRREIKENVYRIGDYEKGLARLGQAIPTASRKAAVFRDWRSRWGFFIPREYVVRLTLYGTGGSYNPRTGTITMLTGKDGAFKRGENALETILHEAVHIGIEERIVTRYGLSHWTKERIVDLCMDRFFHDVCPDYRLQPNQEAGIDDFLQAADAWDDLPGAVEKHVAAQQKRGTGH